MKSKLLVLLIAVLLLTIVFSGCFEENKKEIENLNLGIYVSNYQCLVNSPIIINVGLRNTGDNNQEVEVIIIPDTLQFYITTPEGHSIYCINASQGSIFYEELLPEASIDEEYNLQNLAFGNETMTFNFNVEGIYSVKAVYMNSLESNIEQFKIRKANTSVMTAQQFIDDAEINLTDKNFTIDYKSLDYGDTVILHDNISDIVYLIDEDATRINFTVEEFELLNNTATNLTFDFIGNITDEYKKEDGVNITFHIKWNNWALIAGSEVEMDYSVEGARESELKDYHTYDFINYISLNFPGYLLPSSCISNA